MGRSWVNRYALEPRPGRVVHHSTYRDLPPDWLGPRFLADADHLRQTNPIAYRHEYLGEVVGNGAAVFANLRLEPIPEEQVSGFDRVRRGGQSDKFLPPDHNGRGGHYDGAGERIYHS